MTRYTVQFSDGSTSEMYDTYDEAVDAMEARYPDGEIGHSGDLSDGGDRTIIWETEEDSINDDGAHAVASIRIMRK